MRTTNSNNTKNYERHSVSGPEIGYKKDRVNLPGRKKENLIRTSAKLTHAVNTVVHALELVPGYPRSLKITGFSSFVTFSISKHLY